MNQIKVTATLKKLLWVVLSCQLDLTLYQFVKFINAAASKNRHDFVKVSWSLETRNNFNTSSSVFGAENTHSTTISNFNFNYTGVEGFPRKVYYDNRTVLTTGRNTVCILAEITNRVLRNNSIVACEMNGHKTKQVKVYEDFTAKWIRTRKKAVKYFFAFIKCAGFSYDIIRNHSIPKVIYKSRNGSLIPVPTEHPLIVFPEPIHNNFTLESGREKSIVICTTMYGHPPRFNEWLKYQKTIRVNRVHLNVERNFVENATQVYPFLGEALKSGFVTMEVWEYRIKTVYYYSHSIKIQDCVMRHRGIFYYAFVQDSDDLFTPMVPNQVDIHYYLDRLFVNGNLGCVIIHWKTYNCKPNPDLLKEIKDGNVTKSVNLNSFKMHKYGKAISRLDGVDIVSVHTVPILIHNYTLLNITGEYQ